MVLTIKIGTGGLALRGEKFLLRMTVEMYFKLGRCVNNFLWFNYKVFGWVK